MFIISVKKKLDDSIKGRSPTDTSKYLDELETD